MQQRQWSTWRTGASGCAFILGMIACAEGAGGDGELARVHDDLSAASADGAGSEAEASIAAASGATLSTASSCAVLLADLQGDLLEQVRAVAEQARVSPDYYYYGGGVFIDDVAPVLGTSPPVASAPVTDTTAPATSGAAFAGSRFSQTTVQVPGVDEADFVKAEGSRIYLVQGNSLFVIDARSASATQLLSSTVIEGSPSDLYVRDGQVVVTSIVSGPLPGQTVDDYYYYYYYYPSYAKLTVLDTRGDSISVLRESYVEGYPNGSRRHDSVIRTLVQQSSKVVLDSPNVSYFDIFGNRRSQAEIDLQVDLWLLLTTESIEDSVIEDYLPSRFERVGGELQEQPLRCDDYLLPGPGLFNAGATSIVALDLDALDAPLGSATLLGYAEGVYANDAALLIRQTEYGDLTQPIYTIKTNIHRFELDGAATTYSASGSVDGYVGSPQGLDEANGVIRAVASEDRYEIEPVDGGESIIYAGTTNRVVTLARDGALLSELGRSPDFGDGSLYTARLLDDYAYAFTYNTSGTLFVVDVSSPEAPVVAGQVATGGYLSTLLPLWDRQLLGIGQNIDPSGLSSNLLLQLFDVRDAAAPSLASEYVFGEQGYTDAAYDARALSLQPQRGLLSFPFQNYDSGQTTLEVFDVSAAGLARLASVAPVGHDPTLLECLSLLGYPTDPEFLQLLEDNPSFAESILTDCSYYYVAAARRGLFRGDDLFLVHTLGVDAYSLDALSGPPIGGVALPLGYPYYYYPVGVPAPVPVPPVDEAAPAAGAGR